MINVIMSKRSMTNMKPQPPAEGILLHRDYGDAKHYTVVCECGCDDHSHHVWVESEESGITVHTYTEQTTDYWTEAVKVRYDIDNKFLQHLHWTVTGFVNDWTRRLKAIWKILTKGYIKYEASIIMTEQQALNYSAILNQSIKDIKVFKEHKNGN